METFKVKVGDFITIKDTQTLKSDGETSSLILALAGLTLKVINILSLSEDFLGYNVCDPDNMTQIIKCTICDSDISKVNYKKPQLITI